jgi:hypothetical protein
MPPDGALLHLMLQKIILNNPVKEKASVRYLIFGNPNQGFRGIEWCGDGVFRDMNHIECGRLLQKRSR